jgi:hypothetical protein
MSDPVAGRHCHVVVIEYLIFWQNTPKNLAKFSLFVLHAKYMCVKIHVH